MPVCSILIRKPGMRELYPSTVVVWGKFYGNNGFGPLGPGISGYPGKLQKLIGHKFQKPAVMRMSLPLEVSLKEKWHIDLRLHQECARLSKPLVETLCPGTEYHLRGRKQRALDCALIRP